jgi:UDP-N-acetylmuramate-alanine ligase
MLAHAGLDPTALIGARVPAFDSNARVGRGEYLVAEADESDRSFLKLMACMTVVTNIDYEHLERYAGFDDLTDASWRSPASRPSTARRCSASTTTTCGRSLHASRPAS